MTIRRNLQSVDNTGQRISGLGPTHEHGILIKLYTHEMENLEALAHELVANGTHRAAKATGSVSSALHFPTESISTGSPS
jgi:hypothetical protein